MNKIISYLAVMSALLIIVGCAGGNYEVKSAWGIPTAINRHQCKKLPPLDLAKEQMAIDAYKKLSLGVGLAVGALILGLAFSNAAVHALAHIGLVAGGTLSAIGLVKLFVAQYLTWFMWAAGLAVLIYGVFRYRGNDIRRSGKWLKSQLNRQS